jgi:phenylalanine-4-hydroxylase
MNRAFLFKLFKMKQQFENYTADDLNVWSILFTRQVENLRDKASQYYLDALTNMKDCLNAEEMPNFEKISKWFSSQTGWEIECVPGLIPVDDFFRLLAQKKFPSSTWLRTIDKLDYLEEPDMFHDIFGHIPLLSNVEYSEFIHQFGLLGNAMIDDSEKLVMLQRLYWFTIEFGLILEEKEKKIYGAGILSSYGESKNCLVSNDIELITFDIETIIATPFCTSEMQNKYFIIDSLEQLKTSIRLLTKKWIPYELENTK